MSRYLELFGTSTLCKEKHHAGTKSVQERSKILDVAIILLVAVVIKKEKHIISVCCIILVPQMRPAEHRRSPLISGYFSMSLSLVCRAQKIFHKSWLIVSGGGCVI